MTDVENELLKRKVRRASNAQGWAEGTCRLCLHNGKRVHQACVMGSDVVVSEWRGEEFHEVMIRSCFALEQ